MSQIAPQTTIDTSERRNAERRDVLRGSIVRDSQGRAYDVVVHDLSRFGFKVETSARFAVGAFLQLGLAGVGTVQARVVHHDADRYGCETLSVLSDLEIANAFSTDPIIRGTFPAFLAPSDKLREEPAVNRWPAAMRLALIGGAASTLWAAILLLF